VLSHLQKYCLYIVTTYGLFLQLCLRNHRAPNLSEVTYWLCLVASFTVLVTVNNAVTTSTINGKLHALAGHLVQSVKLSLDL
jgi:hypothetical protein